MPNEPIISILQYNVMKSRCKVMAPLLQDSRITHFDILAIQEPWRNPFTPTTHNPIKNHFHLLYLPDQTTRTCFFVNKKLSAASWSIKHHSPDLCTLSLSCPSPSEVKTINIHNIYNPSPSTTNPLATLPLL